MIFLTIHRILQKMNEQIMEIEMEKEQLNGKIMDREDIKHTFKTRYLNSDKVIFSEKGWFTI